jgi:uncharacterized protein YyaL (SSP411 family)
MKCIKIILLTLFICTPLIGVTEEKIKWEAWSDSQFERAKKENKLVYLNLEAVWCHWCHVMEEQTYSQKNIITALNKNFIAIKVDQDSYPDLSIRYRDYGWPATIIFNNKGEELQKLSGFIEPEELAKILDESVKNPSPGAEKGPVEIEYTDQTTLEKSYKEKLTDKHYSSLDMESGGLKTNLKFLDFETLEFSLIQAAKGETKDAEFVKTSLSSNLKLMDPAWGGVYQYSTKRGWDNPHYEKIMQSQVENMKLYSYAYCLWGDESYWRAATGIYSYVKNFLTSPEGAFYTSQDADVIKGKHSEEYFKLSDEDRRKQGIPAVDRNIYSRENGWLISSLTSLYAATNNQSMLDDAVKSAAYIEKTRSLPGGGFKHGEKDKDGPFLGDTLSMGQAFLSLYMATADKKYLANAESSAEFINVNFLDKNESTPGFYSTKPKDGSVLRPFKDLTENIQATRFINLLHHYTGKKQYKDWAAKGMQYLASPVVTGGYVNYSGILTADYEFNRDPLHITVVGNKDDPASKELYAAGLKYFSVYKRIEWWDKREGSMPNPDVEYPQMAKPAAFICTNKRCSLPIFKPESIISTIKLFHKDEK